MPRPVDPEVAKLSHQSGQLDTHIDVIDERSGEVLLSTRDEHGATLAVAGGSIDTDETRSILGSGNLDVLVDDLAVDREVVPLTDQAAFSPLRGATVRVAYSSPLGAIETAYGAYEVADATATEATDGITLQLEVYDPARAVEKARFWTPVDIVKGTRHHHAMRLLLEDVIPIEKHDLTAVHTRTGRLSFASQDDRLAAVRSVATSVGFRMDFNHEGIGKVWAGPDTELTDEPIWTFVEGGNAAVFRAERRLSDDKVYNGVIALGESPGNDKPPVQGEAWDTNPKSPTYFDPRYPESSVFGPRPFFYVSQFITTKKQAVDAARARLPKVLGLVERLTLRIAPQPGIKESDPIRVVRPKIGLDGTFVIESTHMPAFPNEDMVIVCRERRLRFEHVYDVEEIE